MRERRLIMKIKRELKHGSFEWNDETKMFKITNGEYSIELGKVYAFAFLRFVFRIAQRNWFRKMETKPKKNKGEEVICDKNIRDGKLVLTQQEEGVSKIVSVKLTQGETEEAVL